MKAFKSKLVKFVLQLTTGTVVVLDLCPNLWRD